MILTHYFLQLLYIRCVVLCNAKMTRYNYIVIFRIEKQQGLTGHAGLNNTLNKMGKHPQQQQQQQVFAHSQRQQVQQVLLECVKHREEMQEVIKTQG